MNADKKIIQIATDVLVIGGGTAGVAAALEVAGQGYKVVLTSKEDKVAQEAKDGAAADLTAKAEANADIEILTNTTAADVKGVPGNFNVTLKTGDAAVEKTFGAIVVAAGLTTKVLNDAYGLELGPKVVSQSQLEAMLAEGKLEAGKTVAFLAGFGQEGNPLVMQRLLDSLTALTKVADTDAYVFVGDMKLAADGLDALYAQARQEGVIYFKTKEIPAVTTGDAMTISILDPVLRQQVEVQPDLVVVEEAILADEDNAALAVPLEIEADVNGFLQPDNVHYFPVKSTRLGIYVAGASRDLLTYEQGLEDAGNVALEVKKFLGDGNLEVPSNTAFVDVDKCTVCLTCYRCCPHGAIYWDSRAIIAEAACQGCGICASECPNDAIQLGDYADDAMAQAIKDGQGSAGKNPWIVAFCCKNSGLEAMEMAKTFGYRIPAGLQAIEVPCAGKIDMDYVLDAFVQGADGVMLLTCHNGNCKSDKGALYASWRAEELKKMLAAVGMSEDRLVCASLANNMGRTFSEISVELERSIKKAGS